MKHFNIKNNVIAALLWGFWIYLFSSISITLASSLGVIKSLHTANNVNLSTFLNIVFFYVTGALIIVFFILFWSLYNKHKFGTLSYINHGNNDTLNEIFETFKLDKNRILELQKSTLLNIDFCENGKLILKES